MAAKKKMSDKEKAELKAAAMFALAQRFEGKLMRLTRAFEAFKKKARDAFGGKKKTS